ncbi:MAG: GAF domain-containing sensor histidine kinase [Chloroflexota bacterium]
MARRDPQPPRLLLPPLLEAVARWQDAPDEEGTARVRAAIADVSGRLKLSIGRLRVTAPPLPELDIDLGSGTSGAELALRSLGEDGIIGDVRIAGDAAEADGFARALELVFVAARARSRAERSGRQLVALDQAVRGIGGVLDIDGVLQSITDHVRELVDAQYAALGIVDANGAIERFITSGLTREGRARIGDLPRGHGLLGLIIRENRTYRIPDIATHPKRYGFPPNHPEMHSFLGMPITVKQQVVGRLYLTNKEGSSEFSPEDARLVEMFAMHAGIAIENARLHEQNRRLAIVDERERISRDLHDNVIQSVYAQTLALDDVPELMAEDPEEAGRRVDEAIDALHAVIRDVRNFIFGLRPVLLEAGTLDAGIRQLATELRRNSGVAVDVEVDDQSGRLAGLPIETTAELLAITREALSNVARHAEAATASVRLDADAEPMRLEVVDDGHGFDVGALVDRTHHGLGNMRSRAAALGAEFELRSAASSGTRIIVLLPHRRGANGGGEP